MRIRLFGLAMNGEFTKWDNLMSSDISWNDLIYDLSEGVLSFRMNAISHALPSPNNLRRWGYKSHGRCPLCHAKCATSAHILSNCYVALIQNRYTWRHDNVLKGIHKHFVGIVRKANRQNASPRKKKQPKILLKKEQTRNQGKNKNCPFFILTHQPTGILLLILTITALYRQKRQSTPCNVLIQ